MTIDSVRVLTLAMIDKIHGRADGTSRRNFNDNKARLTEGEDFIVRNSYEAKELGITAPNGLTLLTESGYLLLVKSFTDDLAWRIQKQLVQAYFRAGDNALGERYETLLPSEQQTLSEIVHRKTERYGALQGKALAEAWSRLHRKFRVAKYSQLPRTQLADAILYVTQMELRTAGGDIPPQAAREMISSRDHHAIRRVVWFIANRFGRGDSWTQGIWAHVRAALDHPAPQPFYVDQLPRIAETLATVMRDANATSDLISKIHREAVRRILRKGEAADMVLAELATEADAHNVQCQQLLPELPSWFANDIRAIADRSVQVGYSTDAAAERRAA